MVPLFGFLSGLLPLLGSIPYIRDIVRHETKPHRGSFLIWTILGGIAFFSQLAQGASWSLLLPAADTVATLIIFVQSLGYGVGGLNRLDIGALTLAALGLFLWYITDQPFTALLITIIVDAIGVALTVIKTYRDPDSETFSSWLLDSMGGLCAALAVHRLSLDLLLYPLYLFVADGVVNLTILIARKQATNGYRKSASYIKE